MRLLSKVWKATEVVKNDSSGEMTLPLEEVATNLYKSVIFLGHAFQSAAYYRRYNALSSVMKDHKNLQETLQEKSESLSTEHRMLFGETDTVQTKQKSEEFFRNIHRGENQQVFPSGP